ncbi:hypothetical protein K438DRAFT_1759926 [Mycena galopus ATCC 62051]|nr:hypothetical protein K438DRAFT_1759926 [Mycena galopus ATCC 62051]
MRRERREGRREEIGWEWHYMLRPSSPTRRKARAGREEIREVRIGSYAHRMASAGLSDSLRRKRASVVWYACTLSIRSNVALLARVVRDDMRPTVPSNASKDGIYLEEGALVCAEGGGVRGSWRAKGKCRQGGVSDAPPLMWRWRWARDEAGVQRACALGVKDSSNDDWVRSFRQKVG